MILILATCEVFSRFFSQPSHLCNSRFYCRGFDEVVSRCLDFTHASIQCRTEGALLLTGARGSGKTTLVSCILRKLSKDRWCYTHKIDSKMLRGWCFCSHTVIEFCFCFSDFLSISIRKTLLSRGSSYNRLDLLFSACTYRKL